MKGKRKKTTIADLLYQCGRWVKKINPLKAKKEWVTIHSVVMPQNPGARTMQEFRVPNQKSRYLRMIVTQLRTDPGIITVAIQESDLP